ncbi:hypothetical protein MMC10_007998 [Thelotrema lepadinum]|nr:hypothetical protein [Thelotrema lepadinum]
MSAKSRNVTWDNILSDHQFAPSHHPAPKSKKPSFLKKLFSVGSKGGFRSGSSGPTPTDKRSTHDPRRSHSAPNQSHPTKAKTSVRPPSDWPLRNNHTNQPGQTFPKAPAASYQANLHSYVRNEFGYGAPKPKVHQVSRGQPARVPTPPAPVLDRSHRSKHAAAEGSAWTTPSLFPKKSAMKQKDDIKGKGKAKDLKFNSKIATSDSAEAGPSTRPPGPTPPLRRMPPLPGQSVASQRVHSKPLHAHPNARSRSPGDPFGDFSSITNHGLSDASTLVNNGPAAVNKKPVPAAAPPSKSSCRGVPGPPPLRPPPTNPYQHPELRFSNPYPQWNHDVQAAATTTSGKAKGTPVSRGVPPLNTSTSHPQTANTKSKRDAPPKQGKKTKATPRELGKTGLSPASRRMPLPGEAWFSKAPLPPLPLDGEGKVLSGKFPAKTDKAGHWLPGTVAHYEQAKLPALPTKGGRR